MGISPGGIFNNQNSQHTLVSERPITIDPERNNQDQLKLCPETILPNYGSCVIKVGDSKFLLNDLTQIYIEEVTELSQDEIILTFTVNNNDRLLKLGRKDYLDTYQRQKDWLGKETIKRYDCTFSFTSFIRKDSAIIIYFTCPALSNTIYNT